MFFKRKYARFACAAIALMLIFSSVAAFAASYSESIGAGSSKKSSSVKKTDSDVAVGIPGKHTPVYNEVTFYVIDGGGNKATSSVDRSNSNRLYTFEMRYSSGMAVIGAYYQLRMKAASSNPSTVTVSGSWEP